MIPRKSKYPTKDNICIPVRVQPEWYHIIKEQAELRDISMAEVVREWIDKGLESKMEWITEGETK